MDDQHAHRALARCLFVFVGPAAVIGERLALEESVALPKEARSR